MIFVQGHKGGMDAAALAVASQHIAQQSRDAVACALMSAHKAAQCCTDAVEHALTSAHKAAQCIAEAARMRLSSPCARSPHNSSSDTFSTRVFARGYFFCSPGRKVVCAIGRIRTLEGKKREMIAKVLLVIAFVAVAVAVGIYCRRHTGTVDGFILGGRNVGPWMSAFAYGTSYFSAVVFVGYAGQFGFKYGISATWAGIGNAIIG